MISEIRLQLLAGDFHAAMAGSYERAARYPSAYAYRDYLSLLHAMGKSVQAWQGFSQVASAFNVPQVWVSALVGHQVEGRSERYVREWLHRPEIRNARFAAKQFAPTFAILWNSTDRMPPPDLDRLVESLEDGTPPVPSWPTLTSGRFALAYFGAAYSELKHGRWAKSAGVFKEMAEHYPLYGGDESFALPYFAMAATKNGDKWLPELLAEESHIEGDFERDGTYDRLLARAVIAGAEKDVNAAQALLRSAFNIRPNTDYRPILTEYEYAEVCEWLYRETREPRFAEMLLGWAEEYEKIQPTHAWAYAMEYAFAKPGERRVRALAMTLYLDPSSERIKQAPNDEVVQARKWLARNNPFRINDSQRFRTAIDRSRFPVTGPIRFP
jgi:tetratricopeptide (TPR) repeat protein